MSRTRPFPIDKTAPRYNIRLSKGRGQLVGCAWSEPWGRRLAQRLAEQYGESVVLLDCWTRRRIRGYNPSREAVARVKAGAETAKARLTESGFDGTMTSRLFFGIPRRPKEAPPLSDRAENPEVLPLRPTLPDDLLLDTDLRSPSR
jgi:hypothetical protein